MKSILIHIFLRAGENITQEQLSDLLIKIHKSCGGIFFIRN